MTKREIKTILAGLAFVGGSAFVGYKIADKHDNRVMQKAKQEYEVQHQRDVRAIDSLYHVTSADLRLFDYNMALVDLDLLRDSLAADMNRGYRFETVNLDAIVPAKYRHCFNDFPNGFKSKYGDIICVTHSVDIYDSNPPRGFFGDLGRSVFVDENNNIQRPFDGIFGNEYKLARVDNGRWRITKEDIYGEKEQHDIVSENAKWSAPIAGFTETGFGINGVWSSDDPFSQYIVCTPAPNGGVRINATEVLWYCMPKKIYFSDAEMANLKDRIAQLDEEIAYKEGMTDCIDYFATQTAQDFYDARKDLRVSALKESVKKIALKKNRTAMQHYINVVKSR